MSELVYFNKKSSYEGDITKNDKLCKQDIDNNFYELKGDDIKLLKFDKETKTLSLIRNKDELQLEHETIEVKIDIDINDITNGSKIKVFYSLLEAEKYAKTEDAFIGEVVIVVVSTKVYTLQINHKRELKSVVALDNYYLKHEVNEKITNLHEEVSNEMENAFAVKTGNGLLYDETGKFNLKQEYINKLDELLYIKPSISLFTTTPDDFPKGIQEIGVEWKGSKTFKNTVLNYQNMVGTEFTISGSEFTDNTIPFNSEKVINIGTIKYSTAGVKNIKISGKDIKNNTIETSKTFTVYRPHFIGIGGNTITENEIKLMSKQLVNNPSDIPLISLTPTSSKPYIWICVGDNKNINSVTANTFDMPLIPENEVSIISVTNVNGIVHNYKCYRSFNALNPVEYKIKVY